MKFNKRMWLLNVATLTYVEWIGLYDDLVYYSTLFIWEHEPKGEKLGGLWDKQGEKNLIYLLEVIQMFFSTRRCRSH